MKQNILIRKGITLAVIVLFIGMSVVPTTSASFDDDVEIKIYAGVYDKTQGKIGLGFVVYVHNNRNETLNGTIEIISNNLRGMLVRSQTDYFNLSSNHPPIKFCQIDWVHFPYPVITLEITVRTSEIIVSRYGIEIGPIVIFET